MRTLTFFLVSLCFPLMGFSQDNTAKERLVLSYEHMQKMSKDSVVQREYFVAYPTNWEEFQSCFVSNRYYTTNLDAFAYFKAFEKLTYISDIEKMHRLFNIMVGAHWQADAYNYHFQYMKNLMRKDVQRAFAFIATESEARQILFWQTYWQGPALDVSQQQDFVLYNSIDNYKKEKQIMKEAYQRFRAKLPIKDEF